MPKLLDSCKVSACLFKTFDSLNQDSTMHDTEQVRVGKVVVPVLSKLEQRPRMFQLGAYPGVEYRIMQIFNANGNPVFCFRTWCRLCHATHLSTSGSVGTSMAGTNLRRGNSQIAHAKHVQCRFGHWFLGDGRWEDC